MPKKSLCLIEIGEQEYLLGLSADSITLLSAIEKGNTGDFSATLASATKQHEK